MRYTPEVQSASVVLIGHFNPFIFSPAWFAKNGLINDQELQSIQGGAILPEISEFSLDTLRFDIAPNRFGIVSSAEPYIIVLDTLLTLFRQLLPHTPIDKFGINLDVHFKLTSAQHRVRFGRALAPIEAWGAFGSRLEQEELEKTGGLVSMTMSESALDDREKGWRQVKVERSALITGHAGVFIQVNDHFEIPNLKNEEGASRATALLDDRFDPSLKESRRIIGEMMDFAERLN